METRVSLLESLIDKAEAYGRTTFELSVLKALEMTTRVVTSLVSRGSVVILAVLFLAVLNTGIALYLGELLGKSYYGFFVVAAFYLVVAVVFHLFLHRWIQKPVRDILTNHALQ